MTKLLDLSINAVSKENSFEFDGMITINEHAEKKEVKLFYIATSKKGRVSSIEISKKLELGSIPPCLANEIKKLVCIAVDELKAIQRLTKAAKNTHSTEGYEGNNSFKISSKEWNKFLNPEARQSLPKQRDASLLQVAM